MDPPGTATGHYCRRSGQLHPFATDNAKYCEYCSSQLPSSTAATSSGGEDEGNPPISLLFNRTRLPQAVHSPFSVEFRASSAAIDRDATPSLQSSESIPNLTLPKQSQHRAVFPIGQSTKSRAASTSSKLYPEARGVAERHRSAKAQAIRPQAPQAPEPIKLTISFATVLYYKSRGAGGDELVSEKCTHGMNACMSSTFTNWLVDDFNAVHPNEMISSHTKLVDIIKKVRPFVDYYDFIDNAEESFIATELHTNRVGKVSRVVRFSENALQSSGMKLEELMKSFFTKSKTKRYVIYYVRKRYTERPDDSPTTSAAGDQSQPMVDTELESLSSWLQFDETSLAYDETANAGPMSYLREETSPVPHFEGEDQGDGIFDAFADLHASVSSQHLGETCKFH